MADRTVALAQAGVNVLKLAVAPLDPVFERCVQVGERLGTGTDCITVLDDARSTR